VRVCAQRQLPAACCSCSAARRSAAVDAPSTNAQAETDPLQLLRVTHSAPRLRLQMVHVESVFTRQVARVVAQRCGPVKARLQKVRWFASAAHACSLPAGNRFIRYASQNPRCIHEPVVVAPPARLGGAARARSRRKVVGAARRLFYRLRQFDAETNQGCFKCQVSCINPKRVCKQRSRTTTSQLLNPSPAEQQMQKRNCLHFLSHAHSKPVASHYIQDIINDS